MTQVHAPMIAQPRKHVKKFATETSVSLKLWRVTASTNPPRASGEGETILKTARIDQNNQHRSLFPEAPGISS